MESNREVGPSSEGYTEGSQQPPQQSQPPQQQSQPPQQQPPSQGQVGPRGQFKQKDFLEKMTSNDWLAKALTIGFVLLLVGMLLIHAAPFMTNWGGAQYDENTPDMDEEEKAEDRATENTMKYIGRMITDIGIFFVGAFLALGGIHRDDLDLKYRIAMIGLSVFFILVAWFGFLTKIPIAV